VIGFVDWVYLLDYCIEMAYRKTIRKNGGKKKAGLRRSKRAGLRRSKRAGLRRDRRATRKGGLKRGGLSRRVKRGGRVNVSICLPGDHCSPTLHL
jgi:hypothetical protein